MPTFRENYNSYFHKHWGSRAHLNYDELKNHVHDILMKRDNSFVATLKRNFSKKYHLAKSASKIFAFDESDPLSVGNEIVSDDRDAFIKHFIKEADAVECFITKQLDFLEFQVLAQMELLETMSSNEMVTSNAVLYPPETKFSISRIWKKPPTTAQLQHDAAMNHKRTIHTLFDELSKLESIRNLNVLACIKILRKHDAKLAGIHKPLYPFYMTSVESCARLQTAIKSKIVELSEKICECYAMLFCHGDITEANHKLVISKKTVDSVSNGIIGMKLGAILLLFMWYLWECVLWPSDAYSLWTDPVLYVYVFVGNLLVFKGLWGLEIYIWDHAHINYIHLLGIHDNYAPKYNEILSHVSSEVILYIFNIIYYFKSRVGDGSYVKPGGLCFLAFIPPWIFPTLLVLMMLFDRLNESYTYFRNHQSSHGLFSPSVMFSLLISPFSPIALKDTYAGDMLTSMSRVFKNAIYMSCYFASGIFLQDPITHHYSLHKFGVCTSTNVTYLIGAFFLVPLWVRFAQCLRMVHDTTPHGKYTVWPHTYNCIKYLCAFLVCITSLTVPTTSSNPLSVAIVPGLFAVTLYLTYWDLVNDWGLFQVWPTVTWQKGIEWPKRHVFLREQLMYHQHKYLYYIAIVLDFLLRLLWVLSLLPPAALKTKGYTLSDVLYPFLAVIEQCRRCIWGCYKMEYEHIKQAGKISVQSSDQKGIVFDLSVAAKKPAPATGGAASASAAVHGNIFAALLHLVIAVVIVIMASILIWLVSF